MTKDNIRDRSPRSPGEANASARPDAPRLAAEAEAVIKAARTAVAEHRAGYGTSEFFDANLFVALMEDLDDALVDYDNARSVITASAASAEARAALGDGDANSVQRSEGQS